MDQDLASAIDWSGNLNAVIDATNAQLRSTSESMYGKNFGSADTGAGLLNASLDQSISSR